VSDLAPRGEEVLVCENCGSRVEEVETPTGVRYKCSSCGGIFVSAIPEGEAPPKEALKPPEIEMTEHVVEALRSRLHTVYGISKTKAAAIIDTVKDSPSIALNPMALFVHIKQLERRANDYHLWTVLNQIFEGLRAEGWTGTTLPSFPAFQQTLAEQYPTLFGYMVPAWQYQPPYTHPSRRPPTPMKVVVEGQEITTDLPGYMAWKRWMREEEESKRAREEHELRMKKLEAEIKKIEKEAAAAAKPPEELVEVEVEGQKVKVPPHLAVMLALRPRRGEEVEKLEKEVSSLREQLRDRQIEGLRAEISDLRSRIESAPRTGRTAIDVMETGLDKIHEAVKDLGARAERILTGGVEFRPSVRRGPVEREELAKKIEKRMEKAAEILEAEERLLRAASKLK